MTKMKDPFIFNPVGDDSIEDRSIINGDSTNIIRLNNIKYNWAWNLNERMTGNFWLPQKIEMVNEKLLYNNLTDQEKRAFRNIISFLIMLDSIQVSNLPNVSLHITSPEIKVALGTQTFFEQIHSHSYQYILETIMSAEETEEVYDLWRNIPELYERSNHIANIYQTYLENPTDTLAFYKVLIADYILEGLYFYLSFNFFFNLGVNNKLNGIVDQIQLIKRDEETHIVLFERIINELGIINEPDIPELVYEMFSEAVEQEINWNQFNLRDILGFNDKSIEEYVKNRANKLLKKIGLQELYEGYDKNPYHNLERGNSSIKGNFFESTITNYVLAETVKGWDEIPMLDINLNKRGSHA